MPLPCHGNVKKYKQTLKIGFVYLQKNPVIRFSLQFACNKHVTMLTSYTILIILKRDLWLCLVEGSLEYLKFPLLKLIFFSGCIPVTYLVLYLWNSNEWFSRNRRISLKAFPHSIAIFWLTTHALHLTGFFRLQIKIWKLLAVLCIDTFFLTYLCNKTVNILRSIMKKNGTESAGIWQIKWSLNRRKVCFVFLQFLCARWIASARARAKTVFGHLKTLLNLSN